MDKQVIMISSQYPPVYGGAGSQASQLAKQLSLNGWKVHVVSLDQASVGSSSDSVVKITRVLSGIEPKSLFHRAVTTIGLSVSAAKLIFREKPQAVHVHGTYWWSIFPIIAGKMVGAKTVLKSTRDGEDDPVTVLNKRFFRVPIGKIYGLSLKYTDTLIVLNEAALASAMSAGFQSKTHLVPNGVDVEVFRRTSQRRAEARNRFNLNPAENVVLFVGYMVKHKGIEDLFNAWRAIGDFDRQLWLVGPMTGFYRELDDDIPEQFNKLVRDGYKVNYFGKVDNWDLPSYYWACDTYVLPSYVEGMPNSLAEAIVAGCNIIATDIPGIREMVSGSQVQLIQPGDEKQLEAQLQNSQMNIVSKTYASKLDIKNIAKQYEVLYTSPQKLR